ncbi:dephospho-CoA kinase [Lactobacillus sp. PV037]|uniref:dephospho-CoA kinase n=1 Tax=Lactobacillus sp. PV037 TaxID=2594496 RepID=UPI0022403928|nr:dephospho-CoA kinase [Lactobacillus sp. PV037]QNQ83988.1 dephospho-CoA kinase [Lactobacillus sp. PV037]
MTYFLGLTGGIATGKSTVDKLFREKKIPIIDADKIAHQLMLPNEKNYNEIVKNFGNKVLASDLTIDRKKLGEIVFSDKIKLTLLNDITHPNIITEIKNQMAQLEKREEPLVVLDIPLLFEEKLEYLCEGVLLISAPKQLQLQRLMARNNLSQSQANQRIISQMPLVEKKKLADYVIENDQDLGVLKDKVIAILKYLGR